MIRQPAHLFFLFFSYGTDLLYSNHNQGDKQENYQHHNHSILMEILTDEGAGTMVEGGHYNEHSAD